MMAMEGPLWWWNPLNGMEIPTLSDRFLVIRPCIKVSAAQRLDRSGANCYLVPWINGKCIDNQKIDYIAKSSI